MKQDFSALCARNDWATAGFLRVGISSGLIISICSYIRGSQPRFDAKNNDILHTLPTWKYELIFSHVANTEGP